MSQTVKIELVARNKSDVLGKVVALFSKRCYTIDQLSFTTCDSRDESTFTIFSHSTPDQGDQMVRQLQKLHDVKQVTLA